MKLYNCIWTGKHWMDKPDEAHILPKTNAVIERLGIPYLHCILGPEHGSKGTGTLSEDERRECRAYVDEFVPDRKATGPIMFDYERKWEAPSGKPYRNTDPAEVGPWKWSRFLQFHAELLSFGESMRPNMDWFFWGTPTWPHHPEWKPLVQMMSHRIGISAYGSSYNQARDAVEKTRAMMRDDQIIHVTVAPVDYRGNVLSVDRYADGVRGLKDAGAEEVSVWDASTARWNSAGTSIADRKAGFIARDESLGELFEVTAEIAA